MAYRGHVENGTVVLDEPIDIPHGTPVTVVTVASQADDLVALARKVYEGLSPEEIDEIEAMALDRSRFFKGE
ncbi:MAG TPA: hypothetical protein ENN80_01935 [Candidatus Hydrogenedentes bacterium]|nr:hypothetical protein [Candidatus Hydrogenedentota bacterium]